MGFRIGQVGIAAVATVKVVGRAAGRSGRLHVFGVGREKEERI